MKAKVFCAFLAAEAVCCLLLQLARERLPGAFSTAIAFPFEQLGLGLRALSLSGWAGNVAAVVLYAALCLLPAAFLEFLHRRRKVYPEDALLAVLSVLLFGVIYLMINPGLIVDWLGAAAGSQMGKALLGGVVYSVLCGYALLRVLRLFFAADTGRLQKYLAGLLGVLNLLFVYLAFGACFGGLLDAFESLRAGNVGNEGNLGASYVFLVLQYLVDALPYVLDVLVVFSALRLLGALRTDRYSAESVAAAESLARLCGRALAATILANIGFNLLQLVFAKRLNVVSGIVELPLLSLAFVLALLLLARFIGENKRLREDNDLFI